MNVWWILILSCSKFLEEISDLFAAINLERLNLLGCKNLVNIYNLVGSLSRLLSLQLSTHVNVFEQFPRHHKLKSLKTLGVDECKLVEHYPHFSEEMKFLRLLYFSSSTLTELCPIIRCLAELQDLVIINGKELISLPSTIYRLSNLISLILNPWDFSS